MATTTPDGATRVLAIPELLERVLLNLPLRNLLLAQRVCITFRDTMIGSISLQQKLFFVAKENHPPNEPLELNPFLQQIHNLRGLECSKLVVVENSFSRAFPSIIAEFRTPLTKDELPEVRKGSWSNMLVSNPPCKVNTFLLCDCDNEFTETRIGDFLRTDIGLVTGRQCIREIYSRGYDNGWEKRMEKEGIKLVAYDDESDEEESEMQDEAGGN